MFANQNAKRQRPSKGGGANKQKRVPLSMT
ncbi:hypothetical protein VMF7928_02360 [Vibrio marisflavi CECT 7928]|uniref:Uncharacterized protein n=1 Tax=Vibrio marisflavi CECT 7928 TaxID=634439 RepID=A0ABM9A531_9VIBR|nr:hypothetical protein VMF7928_02360 [Vibrio marisflavi CECT 7928]